MLYCIRRQDSQSSSNTHTIISTQGCSFGFEPISIYIGFYRIVVEIVLGSAIFLAHHIYMPLEYYGRKIFFTLGCRFCYQNVACIVFFGLQVMFFCEF